MTDHLLKTSAARLAILLAVLSAPHLLRPLNSWHQTPELAMIDVGIFAAACGLWVTASTGRLSLRLFELLFVGAAAAAAGAAALRMHLAASGAATGEVIAVVVVSAAILTSRRLFIALAATASSVWAAAVVTLPPGDAWSGGIALALSVASGLWYVVHVAPGRDARVQAAAPAGPVVGTVLEAGRVGYWHWDLSQDRFSASEQWAFDLGCDQSDLSGGPDDWLNRIHPHHLGEVRRKLWSHLRGEADRFDCEYRIRHQDGTYHWALVRATAERDQHGHPVTISGVQTDVSALVTRESSVLDDALKDKLTGLPNRRDFTSRLARSLRLREQKGTGLSAVVLFNIDRFKILNESLGQVVGDSLLAAVANRLHACRREGDVIARLGGDEFAALFDNLREQEDALQIVQRSRDILAAPFLIEGRSLTCGVSMGIAFSSASVGTADELLRNADAALDEAKRTNKGGYVAFHPAMLSKVTELWQLQNDLNYALERGELLLCYQPVFSLTTGSIIGAEALVRWNRAGKLISPAAFIPVAEEMGLIESFGAWALRQACTQVVAWRTIAGRPITVAVNISAKQLQRIDFDQTVCDALVSTGAPADSLVLELTETALVESLQWAPATLRELRQLGVETAIDDFGTGYSSLSYLRQFDFKTLKIDRSFVEGSIDDRKTAALTQGLIGLAHNLGLNVIAEGVSSIAQLQFLTDHGCDQIQGYLASRPIEEKAFERLLRESVTLDQILEGSFENSDSVLTRHEQLLVPKSSE